MMAEIVAKHSMSSRTLAQPCQQPHAGIAVRLQADLALVVADGGHRAGADAAVGALGVEAERGQAALDLLDLGQRRRPFAAGEFRRDDRRR